MKVPHEHDWYWSNWYERFKCEWEDEEGNSCRAYISLETIKSRATEEMVEYEED